MKKITTIVALVSILAMTNLNSEQKRVKQVPNGSKYQCQTCHMSVFGGDARNAFGQTVENNFLDANGDVIWNDELAAIDSDGDGFTNGQELLDEEGAWRENDPNPGDQEEMGHPGDPEIRPTVASVFGNYENSSENVIQIYSAYPNPFNQSVTIEYKVNTPGKQNIAIYDETGIMINEFDGGYISEGVYNFNWDGYTVLGNKASVGTYFVYISINNAIIMQKLILN